RLIDVSKAEVTLEAKRQKLIKDVSLVYYELQNQLARQALYRSVDSLYTTLKKNAESRYNKGDFSRLDMLNIQARQQQAQLNLSAINYKIENSKARLRILMNYSDDFSVQHDIEIITREDRDIMSYPAVQLLNLENDYTTATLKVEKNRILPDISATWFTGTNNYADAENYNGFQLGLAVPLFFGDQKARIKSSKIAVNVQQLLSDYEITTIKNRIEGFRRDERQLKEAIDYYNVTGSTLYNEILHAALKSLRSGEIDLFRFTGSYENAVQIKLSYLDNVLQYNTIILEQMYLSY
ncbi:MAG TPA: TolC family protein, partial [Bacteroidales bacterium]|nr:TolC family protein [Bacteroidales bacterium]